MIDSVDASGSVDLPQVTHSPPLLPEESAEAQRRPPRDGNITLDQPLEQEGSQMMSYCSMAMLPSLSPRHTSKTDTLARGSSGKMP